MGFELDPSFSLPQGFEIKKETSRSIFAIKYKYWPDTLQSIKKSYIEVAVDCNILIAILSVHNLEPWALGNEVTKLHLIQVETER